VLKITVLAGTVASAGSEAATRATDTTRVSSGVLTGTWTGVLSGSAGRSIRRERITLVVNARETAGTWRVSAVCHGRLTLKSISGDSHHYRRLLASGASCLGGDIDCLWRTGVNLYDSVTPRPGGYVRSGTLRRVPNR
jgi:hypothetical protein